MEAEHGARAHWVRAAGGEAPEAQVRASQQRARTRNPKLNVTGMKLRISSYKLHGNCINLY